MTDLVPIFDGFLNDLDDVKAGILRHFSEFLRLLPPGQPRESYLGRLAGKSLPLVLFYYRQFLYCVNTCQAFNT